MQGRYLVPGLMNMHVHLGLKLPGLEGLTLANENLASHRLGIKVTALNGWPRSRPSTSASTASSIATS